MTATTPRPQICLAILLQYAIKENNIPKIEQLLQEGADINFIGENMVSHLKLAVREGNVEILRFLIDRGADINK